MSTRSQRKTARAEALLVEERKQVTSKDVAFIARVPGMIETKGHAKADGRSFSRWMVNGAFKGGTWIRKGL